MQLLHRHHESTPRAWCVDSEEHGDLSRNLNLATVEHVESAGAHDLDVAGERRAMLDRGLEPSNIARSMQSQFE